MEYDDLYSAGCMGLVKACDHFDENRGVCFSTYAVPVILGEIKKLFRDGGTVKVSRSLKELGMRVQAAREHHMKLCGTEPTLSQLAEELDEPVENITLAIQAAQPAMSLTPENTEDGDRQLDIPVDSPEEALAERISLECKRKERGMTHKTSCPLTREQTELLMAGKIVPNVADRPPLLQKLTAQMMTRRLHPVVIVEYERIPFVYKNGNVRITLDTNLVSSSDVSQFLRERIPHRPVMPLGQQLLEVKYDAYLPDFLYQSLQLSDLRQTAYSKYALCRRYTR